MGYAILSDILPLRMTDRAESVHQRIAETTTKFNHYTTIHAYTWAAAAGWRKPEKSSCTFSLSICLAVWLFAEIKHTCDVYMWCVCVCVCLISLSSQFNRSSVRRILRVCTQYRQLQLRHINFGTTFLCVCVSCERIISWLLVVVCCWLKCGWISSWSIRCRCGDSIGSLCYVYIYTMA